MTLLILLFTLTSIALALLFYASYSIEAGFYVKSFCQDKDAGQVVMLTFDDGVEPGQTEKVLDILKKHEIKALFFVVGHKAERYPHLVRRIVDEGHMVGNHSYSHTPFFPLKSTKNIVAELERTNVILSKICNLEKIDYFRAPYGVTNPNIARAIKRLNLISVGWNIRSLDTNMGVSRDAIASRVISKLSDGSVILLHDVLADSEYLLEQIIYGLKEQNYRIEILNSLKNR